MIKRKRKIWVNFKYSNNKLIKISRNRSNSKHFWRGAIQNIWLHKAKCYDLFKLRKEISKSNLQKMLQK